MCGQLIFFLRVRTSTAGRAFGHSQVAFLASVCTAAFRLRSANVTSPKSTSRMLTPSQTSTVTASAPTDHKLSAPLPTIYPLLPLLKLSVASILLAGIRVVLMMSPVFVRPLLGLESFVHRSQALRVLGASQRDPDKPRQTMTKAEAELLIAHIQDA